MNRSIRCVGTCPIAASILLATSLAQDDGAASNDIYELSPFQVEAEEGWRATETLAGSRLRTDYDDIAAQIETLTMDFMDDFSVNSIEEAAIYSLNVENRDEVVLGNGLQDDIGGGLRIRGLAGPTNSRDFFGSEAPSDNYNIDRITISSGPSSLLFGTGSPAGVVDSTLKRAIFKDQNSVGLQVDSFGGYRAEVDLNKTLLEDKLAFRFAGLLGTREWDTDGNGEDTERLYGTFTYKPFEYTTISGHYEKWSVEGNRPSRLYPFDHFTPWLTASESPVSGFPSGYQFNNTIEWFEGGRNIVGIVGDVGEDQQLFTAANTNSPVLVSGLDYGAQGDLISWGNSVIVRSPAQYSSVSPLNREADGWTILDNTYIPTHVDPSANSRTRNAGGQVWNAFVSQRILPNLYVEAAYQNETSHNHFDQFMNYISGNEIRIDANRFLPDGVTANPNYAQYYLQGGNPQIQRGGMDSEEWRVTASYEFDFKDHTDNLGWLGRHRLAGLISARESEEKRQGMAYVFSPRENADGTYQFPNFPGVVWTDPYAKNADGSYARDEAGALVTTGNPRFVEGNTIDYRYYIGPGNWVAQGHQPIGEVWSFTDADGEVWLQDPENTGFVDEFGRRLVDGTVPNFSKNKQDTQQIVYQGFWWEDRLITTLGFRTDEIVQASVLNGTSIDNFTGLSPHHEDVVFDAYGDPDSGDTKSLGIVLNPLKGWVDLPGNTQISLLYNESDTFQPNTSAYRPYGGTYPGAKGTGEDKGFQLSTMNGKFKLRYSKYENTSGPARAANTPFNRIRWQISPFENTIVRADPNLPTIEGENGEAFPALGNGDPYWVVSFKEATGEEITASFSPTDSWDFRLTWSKQEVVENDIGLEWFNPQGTGWLDERLAVWKTINVPEGGALNPSDLNGDGEIGTWTWDNLPWNINTGQGELFKDRFDDIAINGSTGVNIIRALDGKSNEFVRLNRINANAMYRFREGRLKGLSIGMAARHREAPLIGYGSKLIGENVSVDLSQPFYGEDELFFDLTARYKGKMSWLGERDYTVGLTVRNLTDEGDIVSLLDAERNPIRIARVEGRQFILSLDLDL